MLKYLKYIIMNFRREVNASKPCLYLGVLIE